MWMMVLAAVLQLPGDTVVLREGARTPAYAADGRLAIALRGDLWVLPARGANGLPAGHAVQLTSGPAWDREPAWMADGSAIVFTSDRAGTTDLWRVDFGPTAAGVEPERLTTFGEGASSPAVAPDGSVVFVRGTSGSADLWRRSADGSLARVTDEVGAEVEPAVAGDGRIAYIAIRDGERALRIRAADGKDETVPGGGGALEPAWAPDGKRLAFGTGGRSPGIHVTPVDGSYLLLVSRTRGAAAWSPDGKWLAVAEEPDVDVGYNGDPARLGDRRAGDVTTAGGALRVLPAPSPPDEGARDVALDARLPRAVHNAEAFDRVWDRIARLYAGARGPIGELTGSVDDGGEESLARWREIGRRHRAAGIAAPTDTALESEIHAMLRERPPARQPAVGRAGVSSAHPLATAAGLEILRAGGNVVDAAVAVSFTLGVVEPDASGPGGYGEMLIHLEGMKTPAAIEFMTRAPAAATLDNPAAADIPEHGPAVANVPGTVAGMELAWRRYGSGKVPWSRLVEPAIRIAEHGFPISVALATTLRREREQFARYAGSRALFFRDGEPMQAGDTLRNPDLAWTLRQIADSGAAALYRGEPARRMVADLREGGNLMTAADLARYYAVKRVPVHGTYHGYTIYSGPPPVTGGAALVAKLNLLELSDARGPLTEDPAKLHAMIEAWKLQPSTSGRIADPGLWPVDITPFESKDTARTRWRCFDPAHATELETRDEDGEDADGCTPGSPATRAREDASGREDLSEAPDPEHCAGGGSSGRAASGRLRYGVESRPRRAGGGGCRSTGTTAFAVADADGNAVAVTQTLGTWGGNFYVSPGLGFLYNDKFHSYRTDPDAYGARLPNARNSTVIAPTLIYRGTGSDRRPWAALGAAGNSWITSAVYTIAVGMMDGGLGPQEAIELPRFLPSGRFAGGERESVIQIEDGFSPGAIRALEKMGHVFQRISLMGELRMGYAAVVRIGDGQVTAGADPRRAGAAGAVK